MKIRLLAGIVLMAACGGTSIPNEDVEYSTMQYSDTGLVSLNQRCPNTGMPLSSDIEPLYVNGRPIGFC